MATASRRRLSISGRATLTEEITPTSPEEVGNMRATLKAHEKRMEYVESRMTEMTKIGQDLVE
eukprot:11340529-Karenia_brevis.AAC.1